MPFTESAAQRIFGEANPTVILFIEENEAGIAAFEVFKEISIKLKGKILLTTSGHAEGLDEKLANFMQVVPEQFPCVRIVLPSKEEVKKFVMEGDITVENIWNFYEDFEAGNLVSFAKSQPIPETQEGPVYVTTAEKYRYTSLLIPIRQSLERPTMRSFSIRQRMFS